MTNLTMLSASAVAVNADDEGSSVLNPDGTRAPITSGVTDPTPGAKTTLMLDGDDFCRSLYPVGLVESERVG